MQCQNKADHSQRKVVRDWGDKLMYFFQDVNASLEQVVFTDWYFCAETLFNNFAIFFFLYETGAQFEFQTKY